ncbi:programmed cell death 1 ligand 2-like isoform X3 [Oncorhynchus nerka]|nr:programmed cell death 1 ligand 2-like isoform X3 [Oncorhynchus nerka]XP_029484312.1 programmed cell death 1 ligand 2-like isoform X3 [Oncorhynchus nerka]XP_029484316.1 programmed cell death 1 ligand 2-like isoform X3 [Oncorhynchus nerka]
MEQAFLLVLQVVLWPTLAALFTVEVDSPFHVAEFRGVVTMGCRFQPGGQGPDLSVIWHRIWPPPVVEVYRLENRQEDLTSQNPQYRGRVRLVTEEITNGWAKLELSMLRINDSGTYQCLVEMAGADYKQTTLTVKASYKTIVKSMKRRRGDEIELVCESEGYPLATMTWKDRSLGNIKSNDTTVRTPDQLFQVTSTITVKSSDKNNYTCALVEEGEVPKGPSASFDIPGVLRQRGREKALKMAMEMVEIKSIHLSMKTTFHISLLVKIWGSSVRTGLSGVISGYFQNACLCFELLTETICNFLLCIMCYISQIYMFDDSK